MREKVMRQYSSNIIATKKFKHSGVNYYFKYHGPKLQIRCRQINEKALERFIIGIYEDGCPDYFGIGNRCSAATTPYFPDVKRRYNDACKLADIALPAARRNSERHDVVEEFMLVNDASTVAVEIPVWYYDKFLKTNISGHIDIIQIRGNKIHILDYKPEAKKEKHAATQLRLYAIALAYRTGIGIDRMACAWFDDKDYFQFSPSLSL